MSLTKLAGHFGLSKPYNFAVAIPFLLSLALLLLTFSTMSYLLATSHLGIGTERFFYFVYLFALLFSAAALAIRPRLSLFLIGLAFVELALGMTTSGLSKLGVGFSALPRDVALDLRFDYHPLLQGVPAPGFKTHGKWGEVRHNSLGTRGKEIPAGTKKIFVYGGSSTYDVGLGEGDTWVEQLNKLLGPEYTVVNFGVPGYSTAEHILQTAFYGEVNEEYPACALYYVGWNDARNAHIPNLDTAYADFHLPSQIGDLETRKVLRIGGFSPLFIVASRTLSSFLETAPYPKDLSRSAMKPGSDERLEKIYLKNVQTISGINRARHVRTVFMAQIMNRERLKAETSYGWFPLVADKDVWPLQTRFNDLLGKKAAELEDGFVDAGIDNFRDDDFIDEGHFSVAGAIKFAQLISSDIKRLCMR
jgi:lysophospholipase L1-like esterase